MTRIKRIIPRRDPIHLTKEGFDSFQKELQSLADERKPAVLKLAEARSLGDLSENGLYTAAKANLRRIDGRIFFLKNVLKYSQVPDQDRSGIVSIGSIVEIMIELARKKYKLVGDFEANPSENKISYKSPIGSVIFGKKKGDIVQFTSPEGVKQVKILSVE